MIYHFLNDGKVNLYMADESNALQIINTFGYRKEFVIEEKNTMIYFLDNQEDIIEKGEMYSMFKFLANNKQFFKLQYND